MSTRASATHRFTGADQNVFHRLNVHALKVTWPMKLVKLIKQKTVQIVSAKLVESLTVKQKFVRHVEKDFDGNHRNLAHVNVLNVLMKQFCVKLAVNVYQSQHGAMGSKTALMMRKIV